MFAKKFISWSSLALIIAAAALLVLIVFSPALEKSISINPQAVIIASGILALTASVLGFFAFKTSPGKVGAIGGLVLFVAIAILISFTAITRVDKHSTRQPQPIVMVTERPVTIISKMILWDS